MRLLRSIMILYVLRYLSHEILGRIPEVFEDKKDLLKQPRIVEVCSAASAGNKRYLQVLSNLDMIL